MIPLITLCILLSQIQFQSSDPITPDGGISAGWVMVISFGVIGFLILYIMNNISKANTEAMIAFKDEIKNIHKRIDTREDEHDALEDKHIELSTKVKLMESHSKDHAETIAQVIINKMYAISPPERPFIKSK